MRAMVYANGRLPASLLTTVEPKTLLLKRDAALYRAFRMYALDRGRTLSIAGAGRGGAGGYRSFRVQGEMRAASLGNRTFANLYGLNPNSSITVAAAGYSTHGRTDYARTDLVGTDLSWIVAHIGMFGGTREFGAADPNHVVWSQPTASRWRHTVPSTAVAVTGRVGGPGTAFRKRVQLFARLGGYDGPIDGDEGDRTWDAVNSELAHRSYGRGIAGLQAWAGVPHAKIVSDAGWAKVPAANVRAVAKKLNLL